MAVETHSIERLQELVRELHQTAGLTRYSRTNGRGSRGVTIGVTSANSGEGKTTVAMALAGSLARDYEGGVVLADGDFSTRSIAAAFDLGDRPGLVELLDGTAMPEDVAFDTPQGALRVFAAGTALHEAPRVLRQLDSKDRLEELRGEAQYLVMDLPAALHSSSTAVLAEHCDAIIVVVRAGKTTRREVELTVDKLQRAHIAGFVVNRWTTRVPRPIERLLSLAR